MDASTLHEALIQAIQENENCQDAGYHSCTHSALKRGCHSPPMTVSSILDDAGDALLQPHLSRSVTIAFKPLLLEVLARGLSQLRMDITSSVENKTKGELETVHNGEKNILLPHERATVALRSVLSLAPHAWPLALEHWQSSPCPFDRLRAFQGGSRLAEVVTAGHGLLVLLCSSRDRKDFLAVTCQLVLFRMKAVRYLWDWSPFFYLATGGPSIPHAEVTQRANAVVSILLDLPPPSCSSPESQSCVENDEVLAFRDRMDSTIPSNIVGECSESSQERIGGAEDTVMVEKNMPQNITQELCSTLLETVVLQPSVCIIGSILHPWGKKNRTTDHITEKVVPGLVHCSSTKMNIRAVSEALTPPGPLLLFGPPASGKSAILREIARDGGANLLKLHLGDEVDMKTLLGTHVCTDVPGEFEWRAGPLAQAMMEGQWVLIEDLDKAPVAVLASLTPLAETEMDTVSLVVPGQPGVLRPSPGFRLLGTVTTDVQVGEETGTEQQQGGGVSCISSRLGGEANFGSLWRKVWIAPPTKEEIVGICSQAAGPSVQQRAIRALLETCRVILNEVRKSSTSMGGGGGVNEGSFGLRESLKLMRRVRGSGMLDTVGGGYNNPHNNSGALLCTASEGEAVLLDVLDIFVGHLPSTSCACKAAAAVAHLWELRPESAEGLITMRRPQLEHTNRLEESLVVIGRVALRVCSAANAKYNSFALTSASLRVMERIAACIHANEPVLLVGETGCGKTTIIQYLADQCGQQLVVQNMSLQTDSTDLLGGFKPVQLRFIAEELLQEFVQLFQRAFPNKKNAMNEQFLMSVASTYEKSQWKKFSRMLSKGANAALVRMSSGGMKGKQERIAAAQNAASQQGRNRKSARKDQMDSLGRKASEESFAFAFTEGLLVKALREGHWILLDEVNLATPETLQRLCGLLEDADGSLCLMERGDTAPLPRHPNFRIFAAMNPATDISKAPLPRSLRSRFTELFVSEPTTLEDLRLVADACLQESSQSPDSSLRSTSSFSNDKELVQTSVEFYTWCRDIARKIYDGAGLQPHFSMRSFCRAMSAANVLHRYRRFPPHRALYEGFVASFVTQLDVRSAQLVNRNLQRIFWGKNFTDLQLMNKPPPRPGRRQSADDWVLLKPFWLPAGPNEKEDWAIEGKFVITPTVEFTLRSVARAVAVSDAPILLQGPTSSGKTTVVEYVAKRCGHKCVRINNHEHTDLQEYVGSYCLDERGKLVFQEGILVQALRRGHWIILDELNLAPCDVLEALNRLLDDNRELLIEELQEVIKPHPRFRLFATQNPPGAYGGRKHLSRAFRNRFLELHVGDIPTQEWETILARRCSIPPSYAALLVHVMVDLQRLRQASDVFSGKEGFVSPRDLLRWANRWANRQAGKKQELAEEGYMLLAERLRDTREKQQVKEVLEAHFRVQIDERSLYSPPSGLVALTRMVQKDSETDSNIDKTNGASDKETCGFSSGFGGLGSLAMTSSLCRLFILIERCIVNGEAVLLVGPTGCGKTTACQVLAAYLRRVLHMTNCHQTTEAADLLGSLRPVRGREGLTQAYKSAAMEFLKDCAKISHATMKVSNPEYAWKYVCQILGFDASKEAEILCGEGEIEQPNPAPHSIVEPAAKRVCSGKMTRQDDAQHMTEKREWEEKRQSIKHLFQKLLHIRNLHTRSSSIFEWSDGPLVTAMKNGELILLDELSLAEDAVLERLNSVLEPQRSLVLTEKNGVDVGESGVSEVLYAKDGFAVLATMNPGGDFGKRELSPALRSRFTEIWVPQISDAVDLEAMLIKVVGGRTNDSKEGVVKAMMRTAGVHIPEKDPSLFDHRGNNPSTADNNRRPQIELSLRDLLAWAQFIKAADEMEDMDTWHAYAHGAAMTILDRMGLGSGCSLDEVHHLRLKAAQKIASWAPTGASDVIEELMAEDSSQLPDFSWKLSGPDDSTTLFGAHLFWCKCGPLPVPDVLQFSLNAPTTARNTMRLLRAMQLNKAILLEGSPGVGKTGLVQALAAATGHTLVRINLSDQTDLSDLMGNDMPMAALNLDEENANVGGFAWCDGVFLCALKTGQWVLLDEMNLATQQVLEGLNSCLDHRAEVFIPELSSINGGCFHCHPSFRVFAAQNPLSQGGGRKGLPQSFLDRFTRVVVDPLSSADMLCITSHRFPELVESNEKAIKDMIYFNSLVQSGATIPNQVYGRDGSPWEFNLRDVFRWCELLKREQLKRTLGRYVSFEERDDEQLQILSSLPAVAPEYGTMMDILYVQRFRDNADRSSVVDRACDVFGDAVAHNLCMHSHPPIRLTEEVVIFGGPTAQVQIMLQRHPDAPPVGRLPLGLHRPLRAAATCVNMGWPCLLVGPQSSGKTTVVTQLAALVGTELVSIPLTPETDVTELLGGFDKVNTGTETQAIFTEATRLAMEVCRVVWKTWHSSRILACRNSVASIWSSVRELCCVASAFPPPPVTSVERLLRDISGLISDVESGCHSIGDEGYEASISLRLDTLKMQLKGLMMESVQTNDKNGTTSSIDLSSPPSLFKWVDGLLVTAMQRGAWVVFDKANLCSSSVLDRLNPLFEPDGTLLLPESGFVDREIVPHSRFRAFLTLDPTCGEISRSMRNRCVEIALIPPTSAACCPCPGADEFIGAAPPAPSLALLDSVCAGSASGLPPEDALALVSTAIGKTDISSHMTPQMDMRNLRHTAELQAELYRRGLKQRGHSSPSSYYSLSADATVYQCYEMWLVTPLPSPVHFNHTQRTVAGDSQLLQCLCGALHAATTMKQLGGFDNNPDVNHTHLPLLNMVVSVCGESAIPLFDSQLSLMNEMRSDERGEGLWDAKKIFNPMISPIPYCTAEVARRLCCSTDDMTLRSARPLGEGQIGDSIRSCMAYMISKVAKRINQALKGEADGGSVDDVPMKRCDDKPRSDDCDNNKISCCLKEQQFDYFSNCCSYDCPMDPRVDSETELPMLHGSTIATTSGDEVLPTRLVLADIVFLDRLPWLWWESEFVKKRLKNLKLQCFALRSDHDTLALRQVVPLLIPWLSITQTLAKLACVKVGGRRMKEEIHDGTSSSSAQRNTATTIPDMPLSSPTGVVDEEEIHPRPSSSSPLPLFTLIELLLTERDNLCSVFAPWALLYDDQNSDEQSMQFPWEQFIVQWRRAEAAVMNITLLLSLLEDVTDGKIHDVCHQALGICKKISSAVVRKAGGTLPLLTISKEASYYSLHVGGLQLRQNEKPPVPSCAVDAEAIQNLRSISDAMKVDMTVWKIGEDGMDLRSSLTDSDLFLSLLLPLSSPINLRTDVLNALATLTCTVTTDYSIKSSCCASVSSSHNSGNLDMATDQQHKLLHYKLPIALKKSRITSEKKFLAAWEFAKHGRWVANGGDDAGEEVGQVVVGKEWRMNGQKGHNNLVAEGKEYEAKENWVMSKQIDLQLLVLAQHWAAVEELSLLVELENALGKEEKVYNETGSDYKWCHHTHKWSELMLWLRQLVYLLLEQGGCSPRDLVAHQTFLWSCDAAFESLVSLKPHFTCLHQSLLQMKEGCFRRFWTGAFNAYDQIVSMPVGCGKGKSVPVQVCPNFRGPSLVLQYCLRSDILFRMCQGCADGGQDTSVDGGFDVTISNIAARSRQLQLTFDMMVKLPYKPPALGHSGPVLMEHARCTLLNVLSMIQVALPKFPVTPSLPDLSSGIDSVATCTTERFQVVAKLLLLPVAKWLSSPYERDLTAAASSALMFDSHAGCALSLIGAFKLQLCIPADPVDPVRLPAVEESILRLCLSRLDLDIAVRLTSSVLFRGANKRPDTLHIEKRRTELEKECIALKQISAERPPSAAPFAALFNEVHMFAKGLGSPEHIARLVQSLVSVFEMNRDQEALHQQRCNYLQEEKVWQSAAGAFEERLRQNFTYYDDVTVPILESLGLIRAGLRIIAGSVEMYSHGDRHTTRSSIVLDINHSVPSSPIMFLLGNFPWACRNVENKEPQHLSYQLSSSSNIRERGEFSSAVLATYSPNTSGEGRTEFIHAILKRIQLLLLCGAISSSEGVSESSRVIETYAQEWKYASNMEENRKIEDMGTFGYRSRDLGEEELVEEGDDFHNDEEMEKAAIRRLFPDFSSLFDVNGSEEYELLNSGGIAAANDKNRHTTQQQNSCQTMSVKNKDLALIGKLHASTFIVQVGHMATTALEEAICYNSNTTKRMPWWHYCISALSDAQRTSAFDTSYRAAYLLQDERRGKVVSLHSSTLELATIEERLAASHLFALSTAMEHYLPAEQRLTESDCNSETLCCRLQNTEFYRTPSPTEAVQMSIPLTVLLQSVAGLLRDYFPGNAVLLEIARCTERVRGMSVQTSVAQLLAGAQAVLTKAQAWEDVASQAVSLRGCLKPISQLVVRWRKFELEGWRNLMKAREDRMNEKAMEWWPWIHSLVLPSDDSGCNVKKPPQCDVTESGGVNLPMEVVDEPHNVPLKQQSTAEGGDHKKKKHGDDDVFCSRQPSKHYSVDWITSFCHNTTTANDGCAMTQKTSWLWRGFPGATPAPTEVMEEETILHSNVFDALDTFLRTSTVGEFEGRLYLIRAFSGQLACSSRLLNGEGGNDNNAIDGSSARETGLGCCNAQELSIYQHRLSLLLLRLWRHYHQFYASVKAYRDNSKAPIEKSILDEVKLGKWDDQTYYSLAEASQRTHRKLTRLLKAYDEVLESSVAPILHNELVKGIGEIRMGLAAAATSLDEVPSPSSVFYVVADVDGEEDLKVYSNAATDHKVTEKNTNELPNGLEDVSHSFTWLKENIRATSSLSPLLFFAALQSSAASSSSSNDEIFSRHGDVSQTEEWLKNLPALCIRMHYLLSSRLFNDGGEGLKGVMCAEVAEDICAAIFTRMDVLRQYDIERREKMKIEVGSEQQGGSVSSGSTKAVKKRAVLDLLQELKGQGLDARPRIPWEVKRVDISMSLPSPFSLTSLADSDSSSHHDKLWHRADRYFSRSVAELVRLRLEANTTSSRDVTQREIQAMLGFCEDLNLILLQQRAVIDAAATTLGKFEGIVHAHSSLIRTYSSSSSSSCSVNDPVKEERGLMLPMQTRNAMFHVDKQCRSLLCVLEGLRETSLLVQSVRKNRTADLSSKSTEEIVFNHLMKQLDAAVDVVLGCLNNLSDWSWNEYTPVEVLVTSELTQILDGNVQTMANLADSLENMCTTTSSSGTTTTLIPMCVLLRVISELRRTTILGTAMVDEGHGGCNSNASEEFHNEESNNNVMMLLQAACESTIKELLLSAQRILCHPTRKMNEKPRNHGNKLLLERQADAYDQLKGICVSLNHSFITLGTVHALLKKETNNSGTSVDGLLHTATGIMELAVQVCDGARAVMRGAVAMHKSCAKLQYVLVRVFRSIVVNGLCENAASVEEDETGSDNGETEMQMGSEGAGMGSGKGAKDISSEIDDEGQLLGMKGEKEDDGGDATQQPRELTKEEAREGVEMSHDFDGELYDVPQENESEEGDEEKEGEEQQDQMEREMGNVGDMGDIVDQGLWEDDELDDGDDPNMNNEKEEYNSSGKMEGGKNMSDEIRTKESKEDDSESCGERKDDEQQNRNENKPLDSDMVIQEDSEKNNQDDDVEEEGIDGPVNDEKSMDGDQDGKSRKVDDLFEGVEGGEQEGNENGNQNDLPDNMQLDRSSSGDDGNSEADGDETVDDDTSMMDVDNPIDVDDLGSDSGETVEDEDDNSNPTANSRTENDVDKVEEAMGNAERGASGGVASSHEQVDDQNERGEGVAGVGQTDDDDVLCGSKNEEHDDLQHDRIESTEHQGFDESQDGGMTRGETEDGMSYREGTVPNNEGANSEFQRNKFQGPEAPNPMKILGDVLKHWERRLNVLQMPESMNEEESAAEESQCQEGGEKHEENTSQAYQYANTVNETTAQVLGAANEDTLESQQPQMEPDRKLDEGKMNDDDFMKREEEEVDLRIIEENSGKSRLNSKTANKKQTDGGGGQAKTTAMKTEDVKGEEDLSDNKHEGDDNGTVDVSFQGTGHSHSEPRDNLKAMVVSDDHDLDGISERMHIGDEKSIPLTSGHVNEWRKLRAITQPLAGRLCERLRLVLMAQVASRLQGDYRSGKRINMKRVIGYVASHFRKDKIWLRRTKPAKRDYQVMLVIDDTQSMKDGREPLLQAAATAVQALAQLEVGQVGVAAFRSHLNILHAIGDPWTDEAGANVVKGLSFVDRGGEDANVKRILREASTELSKGGMTGTMNRLSSLMSSNMPPRQLVVLFSDGLFDEAQRNGLRLQIRGMEEKGQLVVLVIIAHDLEEGILSITNWDPEKAISRPYLDDYPFPYYLVLKDVRSLPELLSDALRQWFELASEAL